MVVKDEVEGRRVVDVGVRWTKWRSREELEGVGGSCKERGVRCGLGDAIGMGRERRRKGFGSC